MKMLLAAIVMLGLTPLTAHAADVEGAWSGSYSQSDGANVQTVPFVANINENGVALSGMTREPNRTETNDKALFAVLSGRVAGGDVSFTKTYGSSGWSHSIEYAGHFVGADRIEGTWRIGESSGPFVMTRD